MGVLFIMNKTSEQEINSKLDTWLDEDVNHVLFTIPLNSLSEEHKNIIKKPYKTSIMVCPDNSDPTGSFLVIGFKN